MSSLSARLAARIGTLTSAQHPHRRYAWVTVAVLIAIIVPLNVTSTSLLPGTGAPPPETPPARIALPPEPVAALQGRLFFAGASAPAQNISTDTTPTAPTPPPSPAPTLLGTALNGATGAVAVFSAASGQKIAENGDIIDGWRVMSIRNGTVTIRNGTETKTLTIAPPGPSASNQREPS